MESYKYKTYLIGAMQITAEGDNGEAKREKIVEEYLARGVFPIDPTASEELRTGLTNEELNKKMTGWIASGHWDLFKEYGDYIWKGRHTVNKKGELIYIPGDMHAVQVSNWITAIVNKNDSPCGTYGEAYDAYKLNIPIYLLTDIPKSQLKHSFLNFIVGSGGEVFHSKADLFRFIDDKYNLEKKMNRKPPSSQNQIKIITAGKAVSKKQIIKDLEEAGELERKK